MLGIKGLQPLASFGMCASAPHAVTLKAPRVEGFLAPRLKGAHIAVRELLAARYGGDGLEGEMPTVGSHDAVRQATVVDHRGLRVHGAASNALPLVK